jgi:AraC-like DNA-binding protein
MLLTEFSTEAVTAPERIALFEEIASQSHMPFRLRSDCQDDFQARMRTLTLGDLQISALACPHLEVIRTPRLVRQADPEVYQINYLVSAKGHLTQGQCDTGFGSGQLVLTDSSVPLAVKLHAVTGQTWSSITTQIPRSMLSVPEKKVRRLLSVTIPLNEGIGGVLARWLADLNARADELTPADIPVLVSVTTDLLASLLGRGTDGDHSLQVQIHDFIRRHLADPSLSPSGIAAAHQISVRRLYQLFAEEDLTPAAWIRQSRLERCRRDLADANLRTRSIFTIASQWGFVDPAHFSRLFHAAYGTTPREYRHHALQDSCMQG